MENLDKVIKRVIGISEDANKLIPMDKGECKLVAEEWAAMQVKNLTIPRVINLKIMEYRVVMHDLDDDLQQSITSLSKRGWEMFKAYEPDVYKDSPEDSYIRIIWQREAKPE